MSNKYKILVVEDDSNVCNFVKTILSTNGYQTIDAKDGSNGKMLFSCHCPDLIILDLGLPDIDGIDFIKDIRSLTNVPIIVLSARTSEKDKVDALDSGADDYLTKPFSVEELLARLRVTQRRLAMIHAESNANNSIFVNGGLKIDFAAGCTYLGDTELHLTPSEYKILCLLAQNMGKVLTHTYMTQKVWGKSLENDIASLRVFMATLRKKIESEPNSPQYFQTHIGVGYRMIRVE